MSDDSPSPTPALRWQTRTDPAELPPLAEFFDRLTLPEAIFLLMKSHSGIVVFIEKACRRAIREHLTSANTELGGLLLGRAYANSLLGTEHPLCVRISRSIPSQACESRHTCLVLGTDIWDQAQPALSEGLRVIGWYHSHPNLGAFFSGRDRKTQKDFFAHPYSVGLVIDPIRSEEKWYCGRNADELSAGQIVML